MSLLYSGLSGRLRYILIKLPYMAGESEHSNYRLLTDSSRVYGRDDRGTEAAI